MPNIVLEGPDGGGKSTLGEYLAEVLGYTLQQGSGPPRTPDEFHARVDRYAEMDERVFDRHPCVSQPIYGSLRADATLPTPEALDRFYAAKPYIIYCRSVDHTRHVVKPGEDPKHIAILTAKYNTLVGLYDAWALERAHMIYRIGDSMENLSRMLVELLES
jgi:hypothetical protein